MSDARAYVTLIKCFAPILAIILTRIAYKLLDKWGENNK